MYPPYCTDCKEGIFESRQKNFYLHTIFTIMLFNRHKTWLLYKCQKEQGKERKTALKA